MSISDRLDEIAARANAATDGPWEKRTVRGWEMVVSYSTDAMIQIVAEFRHEERDVADAEFIAAARGDVPELVEAVRRRDAALRAVLDLHKRVSELGFMDYCAECVEFDDDLDPEMGDAATRVVWPCPTYRAIAAALGEGA